MGKDRTSRKPRTRQATGQGHWQDRPQCDATDAGQGRAGQAAGQGQGRSLPLTGQERGRPQGKDRAGHSLGSNRAGRRAATGQAAGQGQGRPQGKDRAGHRARTRLVAGQGQDRPQCHWHGATGQVGHDRPHGKDTGRLQGGQAAGQEQGRSLAVQAQIEVGQAF